MRPSAFCCFTLLYAAIDGYSEQDASGYFLPKRSNSPFRTPPRKACHSSGVNSRTGPPEFLLLRTPTPPSGRHATSTQFPLEKLRELLTQLEPDPGPSGAFPSVVLPTLYLTDCRKFIPSVATERD